MADNAIKRTFQNPKTGDTLRFVSTAEETQGELLEVEVRYTPAHNRPVAHYHPFQHEHFEILQGAITVILDGEERAYSAGESLDVPPGTAHTMWNAGDAATVMRWQIRPAMKTQQLFETIWSLSEDGKLGANDTPNLLQAAVLMQAYADEFRLASPPRFVQVPLFGVLGPIGRLLGYRAHYVSR
jgi:quercetin dioxygenase-like cupin family protein